MNIYLGIKYHSDNSNRALIEEITNRLKFLGHTVYCVVRDMEKWGEETFSSDVLMRETFKKIDSSDLVLIEYSEKGVGLGIEAGYAYSKGIPVQVIAKVGSDISNTISGIASEISFYSKISEIVL